MPWCAVPFDRQGGFVSIAKRFKVKSIPRIAIIGPDGKVVCDSARTAILEDPAGDGFPWQGKEEFRCDELALPGAVSKL